MRGRAEFPGKINYLNLLIKQLLRLVYTKLWMYCQVSSSFVQLIMLAMVQSVNIHFPELIKLSRYLKMMQIHPSKSIHFPEIVFLCPGSLVICSTRIGSGD